MSPAIAAALAVLGLVQGDPITMAMGVGLLAYVWLTRHARYEVFQDRLVIYYGAPRRRNIPLTDIGEVRLVKAPLGGEDLVVRRKGGGILVIRPNDPDGFAKALVGARGVWTADQPEAQATSRARSRQRRSRNRKT